MYYLRVRKLNLWQMVLQARIQHSDHVGTYITNKLWPRALGLQSDLVSAPAQCPNTSTNPTLQCPHTRHEGSWDLSPFSCFTQFWSASHLPKGPTADPNMALLILHGVEVLLSNKNIGTKAKGSSLEWALEWECSTLNPGPSCLFSCPEAKPRFGCVKAIPTNH